MKSVTSVYASIAMAVIAVPAFADGVNYGLLSYDYSTFEVEDETVDPSYLQGAIEYEAGQFILSADITNIDVADFSGTTYLASAGYIVIPEAIVALDYIGYDDNSDGSYSGFGAFAQYQTLDFGVGISVSQEDINSDNITTGIVGEVNVITGLSFGVAVESYSEVDGVYYVVSADYHDGPIDVRGYYNQDTDAGYGYVGVRGSYQFAEQFRASALFDREVGENAFDVGLFAIGGGYQITDGLWFDASYGIFSGGDFDASGFEDLTVIQASLTYEIGAKKRIDRRFEQDQLEDLQSGLPFLISFID